VTPHATVEERLTRALTRAAELAVPESSIDGELGRFHQEPGQAPDAPGNPTMRSPHRRARRVGVASLAASSVVIALVAVLVSLGSPNLVPRTQLTAAQAGRLACGPISCRALVPEKRAGSVADAAATTTSAPPHLTQNAVSAVPTALDRPTGLVVFADGERYQGSSRGHVLASTPGERARGVVYLRSGGATYRFETRGRVGELTVTSHKGSSVELRSASGARFALDLTTSQLEVK